MTNTGLMRLTRRLRDDDGGRVTAFVVILVVAVIAFSGLLLDGGLALAGKMRALGEAQEAARAGAQAIDLSAYRSGGTLRLIPPQATELAHQYLAASGRNGTVTVAGNTVTVTVTDTHHSVLLGAVGVNEITTSATGSAQPERGVTAPEP